MKKVLTIIACLFVYLAYSQQENNKPPKLYNKDLRKANIYYKRAFYAKAIPLYEKVIHDNKAAEIVENLANCYYNIGKLKASARFYGYLLNRNKREKTYKNTFTYAQALRGSGSYLDANNVMREFYIKNKDSIALKKFNKDVKTLENVAAIGKRYDLKNISINTENSEFGIAALNDFLVFSASKKKQKKSNVLSRYYGWNNQPFLDIYKIHKDSIGKDNAITTSISSKVNTKLHEATATFSKDNKTMYFTRNNYNKHKETKDDKLVTHLKIYKAQLIDSVWSNIEELPFNGDNFSVEHPALSPDDKRLYFSSDMLGSLGSFDIFYVDIKADGTYGAPVNLGAKINTKHREQFPFIAANGDLYFASNGHLGFGGLDVFWASLKDNNFQKPNNLGYPINSKYDDFSLFLDASLKKGYVSSNRIEGNGSDDIYSFNELKPLIIEDCKQYITGIITDKNTKKTIPNATVTITQIIEKNKSLENSYTTKSEGVFNATSNCSITVKIKATAKGYQAAERIISIGSERNKKNKASLALVSLAVIKKKEEEAKQLALKQQQQVALEKRKRKQAQKEKELEDEKDQIEKIIASEPHIKKNGNQLILETDDIHFDYKLWYIRSDVKKILKRVIRIMKKYPKMQIEIESHTDIRGNKTYNRDLSQKRATSTKMYLISQDIEEYRITAIGYGESKPIKECVTDDACSEEDHEINRRSSFVIKKIL